MNWTKQKSSDAASISCKTHSAHLSRLKDDFYITVSRRNPFKSLGKVKSFTEAVKMCEVDYGIITNRHKKAG